MVENLVVLGLGIIIGLLAMLAFKWWQEEQAWHRAQSRSRLAVRMYNQATIVLQTTDEMLALAEAEQMRAEALRMPTREWTYVEPSLRGAFSKFREVFRGTPSTPDWAPGEVLALAANGTETVNPDPLPPPPPPKARTQPWDMHISRSAWPKPDAEPARVVTQVPSRWSDRVFTIVLPRELVTSR